MAITSEAVDITLSYADGRTMEGFILSRNPKTMRVAVKGGQDAMVLTCVGGIWLSEDYEPVQVAFEWKRHLRTEATSESDFISPEELIARLIEVLLSDGEDESGICDFLQRSVPGRDGHPLMENAVQAANQSVN